MARKTSAKKRSVKGPAILVVGLLLLGAGVLTVYAFSGREGRTKADVVAQQSRLTLDDMPVDGRRAYAYLEQICDLGPRPSGSDAMQAQQKLLAEHFRGQGAEIEFQSFRYRHPLDGSEVPMANLIARWNPDRTERILLCAHYDTRPFPDRDPVNPRGRFIGANDGASGVAVLMELAHHLGELDTRYGIDIVLFDAEELVYRESDRYFLGSEFFARQYASEPRNFTYRWGVLLDMVGDGNLEIYQERNSVRWRDTRPLVDSIWGVARRLGVREFVARPKYEIRDDHIKLHNIGRISTCNIIDFDYPAWHTQDDLPSRCSPLSLAKVGWVVLEWLKDPP